MYTKITFKRMKLMLLAAMLPTVAAIAAPLPGTGEDTGKTVVYRDTWGIPHIYAPTAEAGLFAMGWTQAEDRPEELLMNMARATGESAVFEGAGAIKSDMVSHMWDHYGVSKRGESSLRPELHAHLQAYVDGVNGFYDAHPEDVPEWWGDKKVDVAMVIAFGRMFLYSWSIDDGFGDLARAGIEPGIKKTRRASNQFVVGPERSASGKPILYVDPHLAWYGPSRFWEVRIHAGELEGSGFNLAGTPYIGLGHNANLAWAMTTGAPDTADVYELTLNPENPLQYKYDDEWRDITTREISIAVKDSDPVSMTLYFSHYGPVVAMDGGKAYALKTSYADIVNGNEAWYELNFAKDYTGALAAMKTLTMFPQNLMVADTSGNTYYQRTGRVPHRPDGYDWDRPVDGSTSATEWLGIHDPADHVQLLNPTQGYMQCCNMPPDALMLNSPLTPDKYPAYIYSDLGYGPRGGWTTPRGARAVDLLERDDSVTVEEAIDYALDVTPYGVENWMTILREAHEKLGDEFARDTDYVKGMEDILAWNQELRRYSTGALKYHYWRKQLEDDYGKDVMNDVRDRVDQYYKVVTGAPYEKVAISDEEAGAALQSFANAMATMKKSFNTIDVTWGEYFRVGRDDESWPVGGGGDGEFGTVTLRNVKYHGEKDAPIRMGRAGQTSTQIIHLTTPIQCWTGPPIGQSDRPDSPHYDDQAEKLFSKRIMKPSWWLAEDLVDHIASRTVLPYKAETSPEAALHARLTTWGEAIENGQLEAILAVYASDYVGDEGRGKNELHAFLSEAISNGMLDGVKILVDHSQTTITDDKALVGDVSIEGEFGTMQISLDMELRDGTWLIIKSERVGSY